MKQYQVAADDESRATTLQDAQERWKSERADLQVRHDMLHRVNLLYPNLTLVLAALLQRELGAESKRADAMAEATRKLQDQLRSAALNAETAASRRVQAVQDKLDAAEARHRALLEEAKGESERFSQREAEHREELQRLTVRIDAMAC